MWRPDQYNSFCSHPGTYLFYTGEKYLSPLIQEERIGARWADTWLVLCQCPSFGLLAWQDERQFYVQGFSRRKEKTPPACDVWLATIYKDFLLKNIQEGSSRATTSQITKDIAYCLVKLPPADPSTSHSLCYPDTYTLEHTSCTFLGECLKESDSVCKSR